MLPTKMLPTKLKDPAAVALGTKGGSSTARRRSPEERRQAARHAALHRWDKAYKLEEGPPSARQVQCGALTTTLVD
jgi:hypothetical protein